MNGGEEGGGAEGSAASHSWWGGGCCGVGAVALALPFVPLASSSSSSSCRLWLREQETERGKNKTLRATPQRLAADLPNNKQSGPVFFLFKKTHPLFFFFFYLVLFVALFHLRVFLSLPLKGSTMQSGAGECVWCRRENGKFRVNEREKQSTQGVLNDGDGKEGRRNGRGQGRAGS